MHDPSCPHSSGRERLDCRGKKVGMHEEPLVGVITCVYNREDFVAECIESVLGRTYENLNILLLTTAAQIVR
jgi:hypothetical protein